MFKLSRFTAVAGAAVAAGAIALAVSGTALAAPAPADPYSVTVTPNPVNISGTQDAAISSVTLSTALGFGFNHQASAPSYAVTGPALPAGVSLSGAVISGTPTVSGLGSTTITATVTQPVEPEAQFNLRDLPSNCMYSVTGGPITVVNDSTTDGVWEDFAISQFGEVTATQVTNDGKTTTTDVYPVPSEVLAQLTFTLTCTGTTTVSWNLAAAPAPAPSQTSAPPAVTPTTPTGGVETGGGIAPSSPLLPVGIALIGLAGLGVLALGYRSKFAAARG